MSVLIETLPAGSDRFRTSVTLDDVSIVLRFWWLSRPAAWYCTVETADGTVAASTQRVSCGSDLYPDRTFPGLPTGVIRVLGNDDPYRQDQLGTDVVLVYLTAAEVIEIEAAR